MSSITFKALIDGVHFDPKKGTVKIPLVATSYVSMDKLVTLGPQDESVRVTLESEQTEIESFPLVPPTLGEEEADKRKEAAERLSKEGEDVETGGGQGGMPCEK